MVRPPVNLPDLVGRVVDRLRIIPDEHRAFTVSRRLVWDEYRIPDELIDDALTHGLPHATAPGPLFDHYDLVNLALDLGIKSVWTFAMNTWHRALRSSTKSDTVTYGIEYSLACPNQGHAGNCEFSVLLPEIGWTACPPERNSCMPVVATTVRLPSVWPDLPGPARELIDEFAGLEFRRLPSGLQLDLEFIRRSGMSDCSGAATLLKREGQARGIPIRFAFGLIVAPPFSSLHCWNEVKVEDVWVPIDPLIVTAMTKWNHIDACEWPPARSLGAILVPLSDEIGPVSLHGGKETRVTFPTRILPTEYSEPVRTTV